MFEGMGVRKRRLPRVFFRNSTASSVVKIAEILGGALLRSFV